MELKLLKIGGSIITRKESEVPFPKEDVMGRIAGEVSSALSDPIRLIIIHGAGSYGHPIVRRTGISKGVYTEEDKVNFAETQRLQNVLNSIFTEKLIEKGIPAFPFQASASAVMDGTLKSMNSDLIRDLVGTGVVPVLYGVPAYDKSQGCSILSGDEIMPYVAKELGVKEILHGTNVKGVYTSDPRKDPEAKLIEEISSLEDVEKYLGESGDTDVTGGMFNKVKELFRLNMNGRIFDASVKGSVERALRDKEIGTYIKARKE